MTASVTIAVVGAGYWGKNLVRNFYDLKALKTICDSNTESLKRFERQYQGVKTSFLL